MKENISIQGSGELVADEKRFDTAREKQKLVHSSNRVGSRDEREKERASTAVATTAVYSYRGCDW